MWKLGGAVILCAGCSFQSSNPLEPLIFAPGEALHFDGENDYVRIDRSIGGDFTLELWVAAEASRNGTDFYEGLPVVYGDVFGPERDFGSSILSNRFAFGTGPSDDTAVSTSEVIGGQWFHVAATRAQMAGRICVYVNGVREACRTTPDTTALDESPHIYFGGNLIDDRYYKGQLDEIRIWNRARTAPEIARDYQSYLTGREDGLVGYYRLEATDPPGEVRDSSPSANHGVTSGDSQPTY